MDTVHKCLECGHLQPVKNWPATLYDPPDSTWSDGCGECGGELEEEAFLTEAEIKAEAELARMEDEYLNEEEASASRHRRLCRVRDFPLPARTLG